MIKSGKSKSQKTRKVSTPVVNREKTNLSSSADFLPRSKSETKVRFKSMASVDDENYIGSNKKNSFKKFYESGDVDDSETDESESDDENDDIFSLTENNKMIGNRKYKGNFLFSYL